MERYASSNDTRVRIHVQVEVGTSEYSLTKAKRKEVGNDRSSSGTHGSGVGGYLVFVGGRRRTTSRSVECRAECINEAYGMIGPISILTESLPITGQNPC
jgi:hypothetical protein